ncbi:MAG: ABC transporter permease [Pelagibacteraceae bacterium TMED65]|nr:ABC transporter permease [Rickettsiales bacterium]OUU52166.1 MAG: ABC transporter permease [Pelagibacteraceae bacterium TMED65]|tara:strand:- start:1420 stop:2169 length:750 start_codon:yes stop_codon:yes gene_type:complete
MEKGNPNAIIRIASILIFFGLWQISSYFIQVDLLPGPKDVMMKIIEESENNELFFHTAITLKRVVLSFIIAMLIGTVFGIYMGRNLKLNAFLDDWLILGLNVPALVIIILCYVWFGLNEVAAILAVSLNKIPMVAVIMREGARSIEKDYIDVAKFYKISQKKFFFKVILPQLFPYLLSSARSGLSLIWKIVLVVELLGRSNGVGFKLFGFFQFFDISGILAYTLVFVLLIIFVEFILVRPFEKKISIWR